MSFKSFFQHAILFLSLTLEIEAFTSLPCASLVTRNRVVLFGAFNKRNKQGDLLKKMNEAKKQKEMTGENSPTADAVDTSQVRKSNDEIKKENDMKRFEQLLNSEAATINYGVDGESDIYMTKKQEEEDIDAGCKCTDGLFSN